MLRICKSHCLQRLLSRLLKSCQLHLNRLFFCEGHWKTKNIKCVVFWVKTPDIKKFVTENTGHQDLQMENIMENINLSSIDHVQNEAQKLGERATIKTPFKCKFTWPTNVTASQNAIFSLRFSNIKNTYFN